MVQFRKRPQDLLAEALSAVNSPARITLVSFVLSELITAGLTLLLYGSLSLSAFVIAGICSTWIPYFVSTRMVRQQRIIQDKNRQLQQLTRELRLANAELSDRNAKLDAFSHTVAHDLQTPLSALMGISQLLEQNYTKISPETVRLHLRMLGHTTAKLSHIVDELLLLSQLQETDLVPWERLDMAAIVKEVTDYLWLVVNEHEGRLIVPDTWPEAVGYGPWVEQVWLNYVSNALKYGGRPPVVTLGATSEGGVVRFWVQDNGPGLSEEEQGRLFVPFRRLHETRAQGHGLGLSIVRNIVERLGGVSGVESSGIPGHGCRFYFTLPRASVVDADTAKAAPVVNQGGKDAISPHNRARDLAAL